MTQGCRHKSKILLKTITKNFIMNQTIAPIQGRPDWIKAEMFILKTSNFP